MSGLLYIFKHQNYQLDQPESIYYRNYRDALIKVYYTLKKYTNLGLVFDLEFEKLESGEEMINNLKNMFDHNTSNDQSDEANLDGEFLANQSTSWSFSIKKGQILFKQVFGVNPEKVIIISLNTTLLI